MSSDRGVAIIGAGGHAKVVVSTLQATGVKIVGIFDRDRAKHGTTILGAPVLGPVERLVDEGFRLAILAIGDNRARSQLARELELEWITAVHPAAWIHSSVQLEAGSVVLAGAIVQPGTVIGSQAIVNTGATIDHDCTLGSAVHIAPGAHLAGGVSVGDGALLGVGSSVVPGCSIGAWSTVGAGATVVKDVPAGVIARGVPARW